MQPSSLSRRRSQNYFPLVQLHAVWRDWKQYENGRPTLDFVLSSGAQYVAACGIVRRCGRLRYFWAQAVQSAATGHVRTWKRRVWTDERDFGTGQRCVGASEPVRCKGHKRRALLGREEAGAVAARMEQGGCLPAGRCDLLPPHLPRGVCRYRRNRTYEAQEVIETNALIKAGMKDPAQALATVRNAIQILKNKGVSGPTRIPWGGE